MHRRTPPTPSEIERPAPDVIEPVEAQDVEGWLREQAESYRQAGDDLSAALCFALADETAEAGRCYRRGARGLQER